MNFRDQVWSRLMGLKIVGNGCEGAYADHFCTDSISKCFGGGDSDAEAGKRAGAGGGGDELDLPRLKVLGGEDFDNCRGEGLGGAAVGREGLFG